MKDTRLRKLLGTEEAYKSLYITDKGILGKQDRWIRELEHKIKELTKFLKITLVEYDKEFKRPDGFIDRFKVKEYRKIKDLK